MFFVQLDQPMGFDKPSHVSQPIPSLFLDTTFLVNFGCGMDNL